MMYNTLFDLLQSDLGKTTSYVVFAEPIDGKLTADSPADYFRRDYVDAASNLGIVGTNAFVTRTQQRGMAWFGEDESLIAPFKSEIMGQVALLLIDHANGIKPTSAWGQWVLKPPTLKFTI